MTDPRFDGTGPDAYFWRTLAQGRLELQRCGPCQQDYFPPALVCPRCGNTDVHWAQPSGKGQVYATTTVRDRAGDYNVALVDLEGGARMMSRVEGVEPDAVRVGLQLLARVVQAERPYVVFDLAEK